MQVATGLGSRQRAGQQATPAGGIPGRMATVTVVQTFRRRPLRNRSRPIAVLLVSASRELPLFGDR